MGFLIFGAVILLMVIFPPTRKAMLVVKNYFKEAIEEMREEEQD